MLPLRELDLTSRGDAGRSELFLSLEVGPRSADMFTRGLQRTLGLAHPRALKIEQRSSPLDVSAEGHPHPPNDPWDDGADLCDTVAIEPDPSGALNRRYSPRPPRLDRTDASRFLNRW